MKLPYVETCHGASLLPWRVSMCNRGMIYVFINIRLFLIFYAINKRNP